MIPYDDLVMALRSWRERNGMPTSTMTGRAGSGPISGSMPAARGPISGAMPAARGPISGSMPAAAPRPPAPLLVDDDVLEVGAAEVDEYDAEGGDFAVGFAGASAGGDAESTAIGQAPRGGFVSASTEPGGWASGDTRERTFAGETDSLDETMVGDDPNPRR